MTAGLRVQDLSVTIGGGRVAVHAVNGVSFQLPPGATLGVVGESGSGKSITAAAVTGLLPPAARVTTGSITLDELELVGAPVRIWRSVRGRRLAMIRQDPMTALHPTLTVGRQLTDVLRHHFGLPPPHARRRAAELLATVELPRPETSLDAYPHQFSGGQRQRILIALALAGEPSVLLADEPTTALDVTVQAQIVRLVADLRAQRNMSLLWITHDLALLAGLVDRVVVMYAGTIVEAAPMRDLLARAQHPYTRALLDARPVPGTRRATAGTPLRAIPGQPPQVLAPLAACPFLERCPERAAACTEGVPALRTVAARHSVACVHAASVESVAVEVECHVR